MTWTLVLIGFALAVLMGASLKSLLITAKPAWSARRRLLTAAAALPAITAVATTFAILVLSKVEHGQSSRMEDLAIAAVATIGVGFTLLALVGGLIGAALAGRRSGQ